MDFLQTLRIRQLPSYLYYYCRDTKNALISLDLGVYWFWAALRVGLTLLPQTGYVHPDEYFQTVEVFAGDVFNTEVSLPWEFNVTFPVRSIPVIFTAIYIPFACLKRLSLLFEHFLGFNLLTHYFLLIFPRLSMCLISFISDICLFKICYLFGQNYKERLVIYGSSFVCLVFLTRTFTNSIEVTCFNILLFLVASCMAETEKVDYQKNYLDGKYKEASTIPEKVKVIKLKKYLPAHSLNRGIPIAIATVSGFFNRPTFVFYAFTPLFYWFQRGLNAKSTFLLDFHVRIIVFIAYCIPIIGAFIYFDSAYYGYISWGDILSLNIGFDNFVVTPLNFIKYNIDSSNLSKHGLHPRFLHVLINIPLLFNVLGLSGLLVIVKMFYRGSLSNWTLLPKSQSITGMMTLSVIIPILGLSIFPHQEPRFITPILLPLIFLYSHLVSDFEEEYKTIVPFRKRHPKNRESEGFFKFPMKCVTYIEKATENFDNRYNINGRYLEKLKNQEIVESFGLKNPLKTQPEKIVAKEKKEPRKKKTDLIKFWYFFNFFCILFFGFLHQGGVYWLTKSFHEKLEVKPRFMTYHLVTSHTYSLPIHLLSVQKKLKSKNTNFVAYELGSEHLDKIHLKLLTILKVSEAKRKTVRRNYRVYYAFPSSLFHEYTYSHQFYSGNYSYDVLDIFYPHLSTEALPNNILNITKKHFIFSRKLGILRFLDFVPFSYVFQFSYQLGMVLVQVRLPEIEN